MKKRAFEEINQLIEDRLGSTRCYIADGYSFLKVFQHALSYSSNDWTKKLLRTYWHLPELVQWAIMCVKSISRKRSSIPVLKKWLILDPGRVFKDVDGSIHSMYFERITDVLGKGDCFTIAFRRPGLAYSDVFIGDLIVGPGLPDVREKAMWRTINRVYRQTVSSGVFTEKEIRYIASALHVFFSDFRYWYAILNNQQVKACSFVSHYHNEGLIAALQICGIRSIEIQHGLISRKDIYYVYPESLKQGLSNSFFADEILVYGDYWRRMLMEGFEMSPDAIHVAGDYLYTSKIDRGGNGAKENLILVCSQKNMTAIFLQIMRDLSEKLQRHPDWKAVVKLHPLESDLASYEKLQLPGIELAPPDARLTDLLERARIQVSVYSTTFYDALGYDVMNYSVTGLGSDDYAEEMILEKMALPMQSKDDVVELYAKASSANVTMPEREDVYGTFLPDVVRRVFFS